MPKTVMFENISEFRGPLEPTTVVVFFHTELFEACIVYKQLPLSFVVDLSETFRFWRI